MQHKVFLALALVCLATLPLFNARSLLEEGDLVSLATAALESGKAMSAEESMLMQASGAYGAGSMAGSYGGGSAGGLLDNQGGDAVPVTTPASSSTGLEAGNQDSTSTSTTTAPAKPAATTAKSAASPAAKSTGLAVAGVMVALSAFLL